MSQFVVWTVQGTAIQLHPRHWESAVDHRGQTSKSLFLFFFAGISFTS